ncbi:uncharacterized protein LOC129910635 [Episyrphus balteatus]|uniref:uncharacterized protein LOC129910635 n=1 Tax=Episyrphus balteatus TaxID=286459 RepID=UPI002485AD81|nr:uncharacterized protein LOC129910635 [Episyrphus balteatus]
MSQTKESAIDVVDKVIEKLPESKLEFKAKPPQAGYEAVYGQRRRQSASRRRLGWCEDARRNNPQSHSLAAATLIFASGGMNLVSSIGFGSQNNYRTHNQVSWFIAVIIGSCISTSLVEKVSKRIFNLVASVFVIIGAIFYMTASESNSTITSARYCDGIAFGLTLIPAILAGSEQSVKRFRGLVLSVEQIGLAAGALVKMIYWDNWGDRKINLVHGSLGLIYGVLALIFTFTLTIESPVQLLRKEYEDEAAVDALRQLQRPNIVTHETYALLNEHKALLQEDMNRESKNISKGWIPMIKVTLFRCMVSMSISFPLTFTFLLATSLSSRNGIPMSPYVYILFRLIGVTFSLFFLDTLGRRIPSALALLFGGVSLFIVGWLASSFWNTPYAYIQPAVFLLLVYQLLSGIMAPSSTCYLSEAYSVSVKPYFILASVIAENVLQVIICLMVSNNSISNYACALGGMQVVYAIVYFFTMPETMQTTLREALKLFQRIFVINISDDDDDDDDEERDADGSEV